MTENQINRIIIPLDFADADSAWQMVVIGRSITASNNPVDALREAQREVESSDG